MMKSVADSVVGAGAVGAGFAHGGDEEYDR
jgi:hypothetical protein